jgi:P-type Ca2+ transporter type 2A
MRFYQTHFHQCSNLFPEIGCEMFTSDPARHASTMSLSILVTVEMFNAMNSLSENESLLRLPIWKNMFLVAAITLSMVLHVLILYVPFLTVSRALHNRFHLVDDWGRQSIFAIVPLNWIEWKAVLWLSAPVVVIDEVLKLLSVRLYLFFLSFSCLIWLFSRHYLFHRQPRSN